MVRGNATQRWDVQLLERLLAAVRERRRTTRRHPFVLGLSGVQGSGKSTLAAQLCARARAEGITCQALALDDFYLPLRTRAALARDVHPLLRTRGVPGTHDVALLEAVLADAASGTALSLPRFDKGRDTRTGMRRVPTAPQLLILEGWCVGVPAQSLAALRIACNALERGHDGDGSWRARANAQLGGPYARIWRRLDLLVMLRAPGFDDALRWRAQAERELRARGDAPHAMGPRDLRRFMMHFERISRHALRVLPGVADVVVTLDRNRRVSAVRSTGNGQVRSRR